jgi:hypothetical protein
MEHSWDYTDKENENIMNKTCPSATLSTKNPTQTDLVVDLDLCNDRPLNKRRSRGTAIIKLSLQ